jgi:hypothetical protein
MSPPRIIAGIDPGVKTGLAIWHVNEQRFSRIGTFRSINARVFLRDRWKEKSLTEIWFEDARLRSGKPDPKRLQGVGSVKRDCAIWEEFCKFYKIPYRASKPDKTLTKWSEEYFKKMTGWDGRTSQHARDAAALVFGIK